MKSLETILDQCIDAMRDGQDIEEVLRQHAEVADQLRPLLDLASDLESLPAPSPSVAGMARTMARFTNDGVPYSQGKGRRWTGLLYRSSLAQAAGLLLVASVLFWGTITVSAGALPGDLFYPIKLATERTRFYLSINAEDKAELRIVFSEERLKEVVKLYGRGDGLNEELLEMMLEEARKAVEVGTSLEGESSDLLVVRAANLSDYQHEVLGRLSAKAPPEEREIFSSWMGMCGKRGGWMRGWVDEPQNGRSGESPGERRNRRMMQCPMR